jgi:hypothetical protein
MKYYIAKEDKRTESWLFFDGALAWSYRTEHARSYKTKSEALTAMKNNKPRFAKHVFRNARIVKA